MKTHLTLSVLLFTASAPAAVIMTQPVEHYFQASDSPYYDLFPKLDAWDYADAYINTFEDNDDWPLDLGWEFASLRRSGSPTYGMENFSVDGDDGSVDGWDRTGSGITGDGLNITPSLDFYFRTIQHTSYPLWVGFVITVPAVPDETFIPEVELLGLGGTVLGRFSLYEVRQEMLEVSLTGGDAEFFRVRNDRLVFFHSDEPITRVRLINDPWIDHFQYGYTRVYVPEPGSAALLGGLAAAGLMRRRRWSS